jgi:hypothetical protein
MSAPSVGACLEHSSRLLRSRSGAAIALGAGIVLALISVCCGTGVLMTPWLMCELIAMQLAQALNRPFARRRTWFSAGVILLGAVLLTSSVGWLTWLGVAADAGAHGTAGLLASASAVVALVFVLPFLYAPLLLVEGRAGLGGAVLESARLVMAGGALPHMKLSLAANTVQVAPLLIVVASALAFAEIDRIPLWGLLSLPLLSFSVPLGQGMLVSAYVNRRSEIANPRRTRVAGRPPVALVLVWAMLVIAPILSFGLLGTSLVRPSRLIVGALPPRVEPVAHLTQLEREHSVYPPGTALQIAASAAQVRVIASDGGGAGRLPLRSSAKITSVRVGRERDRYGIEVLQAGLAHVTWIDRAGVRLDDDLRARLLDRLPPSALWLMLASLLSTACALLPVMASLGELRRLYTLESGARPAGREISARRAITIRRAFGVAIVLSPLAVLSLYWGAHSLLG